MFGLNEKQVTIIINNVIEKKLEDGRLKRYVNEKVEIMAREKFEEMCKQLIIFLALEDADAVMNYFKCIGPFERNKYEVQTKWINLREKMIQQITNTINKNITSDKVNSLKDSLVCSKNIIEDELKKKFESEAMLDRIIDRIKRKQLD
jgi:hypothetical protein